MEQKDAVIVGARCAGSTLAIGLAERGWDVLLVDSDTFPSETISTHGVYPNTLARLEQLGVMDTLRSSHDVALLANRMVGLGHEVAGLFSPIGGYDRMAVIRRSALDEAILDTAVAAGAEARVGERVLDLIGSGTPEDPVAGVVMENGERVRARWVFGADGRGSTVARKLGIEKERVQKGEVSFLFAYWRDIPDNGYGTLEIHEGEFASRSAVEDGLHLLIAIGDAELSRGTGRARRQKYCELLSRFPETIEPVVMERAEMVGDVVVAPESLMRGFFRKPTGPGWALLGDAGHFKHPGTAQGICDAVEQAIYLAEQLSGPDPSLDGYEAWRDARAVEHYDWSFLWGRLPHAETSEKLWTGWAMEADAGQDLRDSFSRLVEPSRVMSKERLARWFRADANVASP
ncbi:MAG: NAD(P)/FAD-dependent oxidoreductase [Solirubrobacteraceae bacterium]